MSAQRINEFAAELSVHPLTIRRKIKAGTISYHRAGKIYLFTDEDRAAYLQSIAVPAGGAK